MMRTKITVAELRPGMRVVDTGLSWIENPYIYATPGVIESDEQVQELVEQGYVDVFVDADSIPQNAGKQPQSVEQALTSALERDREELPADEQDWPQDSVSLNEELGPAKRIHEESLRQVKSFIRDVRLGSQPDYTASEELVTHVIDSVTRNSHALLSLSKLRSFDEYTYTHCVNVAVLTLAFARHLNYPLQLLEELGLAALFHDLGKARIPDAIINKPAKLSEEEFEVIKKHPDTGVDLLNSSGAMSEQALRGVAEHHEKYNGRGYPKGLVAQDISIFGSVICLADVYDALTSERVYKKGIQPNKAMATIYSMRGQDFFPNLVTRFVRFLGIYPIGSLVQLHSGEYALVASPNPGDPMRPNVLVVLDPKQRPCPPKELDLSTSGDEVTHSFDPREFGVDPARYLL